MIKKTLIYCFLFSSVLNYGQTTLGIAKEDLKKSESTSSSSKKNYNDTYLRSDATDSDGNFFTDLIGQIFIRVFAYTAYGILADFGELENPKHRNASISLYPYFEEKKGDFYLETGHILNKPTRFQLSNQFIDTNQKIKGNFLKGELQFAKRFSVVGDVLYLTENNFKNPKENYTHFSLVANYYRIRTERMSLWYGLGLRYVGSGVDELGFAYSLGTRIFIAKPISIEATLNNAIVNDKPVNHYDLNTKYHIKNKYLSLGYNSFRIGSESFGGISAGLGIYF